MKNRLWNKRLHIVSGKGGTGKTSLAAAMAIKYASQGKRVCMVESSINENITPLFHHSPVAHNETQIMDNLYALNISPQFVIQDYLHYMMKGWEIFHKRLFQGKIVQSLLNTIPYLNEILVLGRIYWMLESKRSKRKYPKYDIILYDAPATGHTLNILKSPDTVINALGSSILKGQIQNIIHLLNNNYKTGLIITALPRHLSITETIDFIQQVSSNSQIQISGVYLNQVPEKYFDQDLIEMILNKTQSSQMKSEFLQTMEYSLKITRSTRNNADYFSNLLHKNLDIPIYSIPYFIHRDKQDLISFIASRFE